MEENREDKQMKNKLWSANLVTVLTAAALAASMTACGSGNTDTGNTETAAASSEAVTEAGTSSDTEAAGTEETSSTETASSEEATSEEENALDVAGTLMKTEDSPSLDVSITDQEVEDAGKDVKNGVTTKIQFIQVNGDGYEKLQQALDKDNADSMELAKEDLANLAEIPDDTTDTTEDVPQVPYEMDSTVILKRADEKVVSYLRESFSQLGGAHPSTYYTGKNYDAKTGEVLTLRELTPDYDGLYQYVCEELAKRNSENPGNFFDDYESTVHELFYGAALEDETAGTTESGDEGLYLEMQGMIQWYLDKDGLSVIFNDYDIAPYAAGPSVVTIPFSSGLLNTDWEA